MTTADRVDVASVFPPLTPHHDRREDGSELVSYATLRRVVGLLGVALPVVVAIVGFVVMGWWRFEPTISDYYAIDSARNAFVGILFTIAWFLFTYRGFDWRDRTTGVFACIFALGVALVPCTCRRSQSTTTWPPRAFSSRSRSSRFSSDNRGD